MKLNEINIFLYLKKLACAGLSISNIYLIFCLENRSCYWENKLHRSGTVY
jgi:hypothetical protein